MDINLVLILGRLVDKPEYREHESGLRTARLLVAVSTERPRRRLDVIPVTVHDPDDDVLALERGDKVWVSGSIQRRFWDGVDGRRSRLEVVADQVVARDLDPEPVG